MADFRQDTDIDRAFLLNGAATEKMQCLTHAVAYECALVMRCVCDPDIQTAAWISCG
jgi:hypothetical protein